MREVRAAQVAPAAAPIPAVQSPPVPPAVERTRTAAPAAPETQEARQMPAVSEASAPRIARAASVLVPRRSIPGRRCPRRLLARTFASYLLLRPIKSGLFLLAYTPDLKVGPTYFE